LIAAFFIFYTVRKLGPESQITQRFGAFLGAEKELSSAGAKLEQKGELHG